jgi:wyosine [tRNA(Phe)-imidazoG37] synthetase (radical SAM superfamily)
VDKNKLDIQPLRSVELQSSCIYGPVRSRRLGQSLGINPLPAGIKICSFDCLYCQYGFEKPVAGKESVPSDIFPTVSTVLDQLERSVNRFQGSIDAITFSGNGEPTLHPDFLELVRGTVKIRDHYLPKSRVVLLSNGTTVCDDEIQEAIKLTDDPIVKLDAGDRDMWFAINRPEKGIDLDDIVSVMAAIDHIIVQSLFFSGDGDRVEGNISEDSIDSWLSVIEKIQPRYVQVHTLDRTPAMNSIKPAPMAILLGVQSSLEKMGIEGRVY